MVGAAIKHILVHVSSLFADEVHVTLPLSQSVGAKLDKLAARGLKAAGTKRKEESCGFLDSQCSCQTLHHRLVHDVIAEAA